MGLQSLDAPKSLEKFALLLAVDSRKEPRSVMIRNRLLFKMLLRNSAPLSLNVHVSMGPSWCQSFLLKRNVLMFPRKSAPGQEPTQEKSRSQLSRNGAMSHQKNLDLPNFSSEGP